MKRLIRVACLCLMAIPGVQAADLILESDASDIQNQAQLQLCLVADKETTAGLHFDLEFDDSLVNVEVLAALRDQYCL